MQTDAGVLIGYTRCSTTHQALAAVRAGDTLVVPKLDRLARSVPDARAIGDQLVAGGVKLQLGAQRYDPSDPMGKLFFNILATFAEFESDLARLRAREGMAIARPRAPGRPGADRGAHQAAGELPAGWTPPSTVWWRHRCKASGNVSGRASRMSVQRVVAGHHCT